MKIILEFDSDNEMDMRKYLLASRSEKVDGYLEDMNNQLLEIEMERSSQFGGIEFKNKEALAKSIRAFIWEFMIIHYDEHGEPTS